MIFEKQILNAYRNMAYSRCDDNGTAFYFSNDNFPGLSREAYSFSSSSGHKLQGYIYSYENPKADSLVIFDHGFGGGHRSYMKEIEMLARGGYTVLAYDHTGCMESGGEGAGGMANSLHDLDDCLKAVKSDSRFEGLDICVVGHSWGGFSTLNISALHPEISHVVVLSGFVSVKALIDSYFPGIMKLYRKAIMNVENEANPYYVKFNGVDSLRKSKAKALLIYSDDDKLCKRTHYDILKSALEGREGTAFKLVSGKGHNPNYTKGAVKLLGEYVAEKTKLAKKGRLGTDAQKAEFLAKFDFDKMTEQDESVWADILAFLAR